MGLVIVKTLTINQEERKERNSVMEKRYTLPVAIALVVGTVIGSGVFFKAEAVLTKTGGNLSVGILAFIIMGVVMIISACTFGVVAQSHEGVGAMRPPPAARPTATTWAGSWPSSTIPPWCPC